jgi:glycosyltransferase involved in cell wall biosynthesis
VTGGVKPELSVITPSFNSARFLRETLDSVAALAAPHEHIVIDGGSTDETVEILGPRRDPSLIWVSEPDRGQTHAVNKGLEGARAELIAWLNADDAYISENVDEAVRLLERDPSVDAVFGFMDIVDEQGRILKRHRCGRFSWSRYLYFGGYLPTPTIIFRRSLLTKAPRLDERYSDAADYDFYLRLLRGAMVRRLRRTLVRFRYHPASKSASNLAVLQREALDIRFRYARNGAERWLIRGANRVALLRDSILPPWPELPNSR